MSESHEEWKKRTQYPDNEKERRETDQAWDMKMARLGLQNTISNLLAKEKAKAREEEQNVTTSDESEADGVEESGQPS